MSTVSSLHHPGQPRVRGRGFQVLSKLARAKDAPGRHAADDPGPGHWTGSPTAEPYEPRHRRDEPTAP